MAETGTLRGPPQVVPTTCGRGEATGHAAAQPRVVYRLRDLDRRGRCLALAFALALSLPPVLAFSWALPDWAPSGDVALMGIRALDVGTVRTPLIGQPSTAGRYIGSASHVSHPGPTHFYLLAIAIRLFGGDVGMPLVTVLIVEACVLLAAWAVFRQLGAAPGIVAAVLLGAIMFTTGTSSLVDPVSSRVAGYPLLCASVLCWCVFSGDMPLLPLATAVVSFTAQQHLSVAPAIVVLTASAVLGLIVALMRRPQVIRWCGWSVVVALVLWAPVLLQQVVSPDGNLGRILGYARSGRRATLGATSALYQIANSLGLPPLLGQTAVTGGMLLSPPSALTWFSAVAVVVIVATLGFWWRTRSPRRATLAVMVAVVALAGFANGSSVPVGLFEELRIAFYHWSFAMAFFTWLVLGLGVLELMSSQLATRATLAPALTSLALVAIILPAAINPSLERDSNRLRTANAVLESRYLRQLGDAALAHRRELGAQTLLLSRGAPLFAGFPQALAFELTQRGIDVRHPLTYRDFVDSTRLVERSAVDTGLVLVVDRSTVEGRAPHGDLLAHVDLEIRLDVRAFEALIAQAQSGHDVQLGRAAEEGLEAIADPFHRLAFWLVLGQITRRPRELFMSKTLRFLRDHPIEQPRLDPALIERVLATVPEHWGPDTAVGLRLYLVDRVELLRIANPGEL